MSFFHQYERKILGVICLMAMVRIFIFSAAFPFFNNVDEWSHFDVVHKYSRGYLPRQADVRFDPESVKFFVFYCSPEYLRQSSDFSTGRIPPALWRHPINQETIRLIQESSRELEDKVNDHAFSPPVYYLLAACWFKFGQFIGLQNLDLLYWIRFLNIPIFTVVVYLSYLFCLNFFPNHLSLRIGSPLLIAFLPQDALYAITNDALSPLLFGASLYFLLRIFTENQSKWFYAVTGLTMAAAFLTKLSNSIIIPLAVIIFIFRYKRLSKNPWNTGELSHLLLLIGSVTLPLVIWFGWNSHVSNDFLGVSHQITTRGWTRKPFFEWWDHPLFTFDGLKTFFLSLITSFWRGGFFWNNKMVSSFLPDLFYIFTSIIFISLSFVRLFFTRVDAHRNERFVGIFLFISLFLFLIFLMGISIQFDYNTSPHAYNWYPFFSSGRMILGGLIPFSILYLRGLTFLFSPLRRYFHPLFLLLPILLFITYSEISMSWVVFKNLDNWFHASP